MKKRVLKTIAILFGSAIFAYLLLVITFSLPTRPIKYNVASSASSFQDQWPSLVDNKTMTKIDRYTDTLTLLTSADDYDNNPFTKPIYAYHLDDQHPNGLYNAISHMDDPNIPHQQYSRYWHGYQIFLRPLLLVFNYSNIQIIISIFTIILFASVVYLLSKRGLDRYIIPYILASALMFLPTISINLQFFTVFAITNIATIVILLNKKIANNKASIFYFFLVIGIVTNFFDLLSYPLATLGYPLLFWLLLAKNKKRENNKYFLKQIASGCVAWCIGYFVFWIEKWLLGSIITGENLFSSALEAAKARSSTEVASANISRIIGILKPMKTLAIKPIIILLVIIVILFVILLIIKKIKISREKAISNMWILVIALLPFIWCLSLANHSAIHLFFSFRTMTIAAFAITSYIVSVIEIQKTKKSKKLRRNSKNK